jgi:hypothetical protein
MKHLTAKAAILFSSILIVLGVIVTFLSTPVFGYTQQNTYYVRKSETVMNYSFYPSGSQLTPTEVFFECETNQTLSILLAANIPFDFGIASQQPNGTEAIYFSQENTVSINTTWEPEKGGSYYMKFTVLSEAIPLIDANVTENWTELATKSVTQSFLDANFAYVGLSIAILGLAILAPSLLIDRRNKKVPQL